MSAQGDEIRAQALKADALIARTRAAWETFGTELDAVETEAKALTAAMRTTATVVDPLVPPAPVTPPASGWVDVWRDEFAGTTLDTTKWDYEHPLMNVKPSGAQQFDGPNVPRNVTLSGGEIHLAGVKEAYTYNGVAYKWTAAGIISKGTPFHKGERLVMHHRADVVAGFCPCYWSSSPSDDGEYDNPEMFGIVPDAPGGAKPGWRYNGFKSYSPLVQKQYNVYPADNNDHESICQWNDDNSVQFFLDGVLKHTIPASFGLPQTPHLLRLTMQVGGVAAHRGVIDPAATRVTMHCRYVAVQRRS